MERVAEVVERVSRALHWVAGAVMVGMMLMIMANIVGRTVLGRGVRGTVELTQLMMISIVFLGLAFAYLRDDHITMDLLYTKLQATGKKVLVALSSLVTLVILLLLSWQLLEYRGVLEAGGRHTNTLQIPLHPVAWVAITGTVVFVIAVIAGGIQRFRGHGQEGTGQDDDTPRPSEF